MRRGFTMVEMLLALAVFGFVGMMTFAAVSTVFATSRDLDDIVEVNHMGRVAMDRLTRDLSHAFLSLNFGLEERTKTVFVGERDRIVFAYLGNVPVHAGANETDQGIVEFRLDGKTEGREGKKLIRRFKARIDDSPNSGGEEAVVAEGVKSFKLEYYDKVAQDWQTDWKAEDPQAAQLPGYSLPSRVRITIELYDRIKFVHLFSSQTNIYMTEPLLFGSPSNPKVIEWAANYIALHGVPPPGYTGITNPMPGGQPLPSSLVSPGQTNPIGNPIKPLAPSSGTPVPVPIPGGIR